MKKRILLPLLALVVLAGVVIGGKAWLDERERKAQYQARREMETRLEAVCESEGVAEAAAYPSARDLHPVLYVKQTTVGFRANFSGYRTPEGWGPQTLADAELVACIVEDQVELQRCSYTLEDGRKGTIIRVQYQTAVTLRAAQTGEVIAANEFTGGIPRECSDQETFKDNKLTRSLGGTRPDEAIAEWLRTYVEP
ncbi:MAG: hypothetical protein D6770_06915 [Anaerolineae bacterium]|nr:MAG: hypothetical protein D6770_06915 [Anaerolineae bacterium]